MDSEQREQEFEIDLTEYYYIISKHKILIFISLFLVVGMTAIFTYLSDPIYEASALMVIDKEQSPSFLKGEFAQESYLSETMTFKTHLKLITSRKVLEKVVNELKLGQIQTTEELEVSFFRKLIQQYFENIRLVLNFTASDEKVLTPEEKMLELIGILTRKINIKEIRDTRLLQINVEDNDPVRARNIANALVKAYIEFNISNRLEYSQNTMTWMTGQLYEIQKKLEDAEMEFQTFKHQEKLFSIEDRLKLISSKISEFNDAYLKARNERLEVDASLAELTKLGSSRRIEYIRSLVNNPVIDNLYSQLLEAEVEYSRMSNVFKDKHPKLVQMQTKLSDIRTKLTSEINKELESMKAKRSVLLSRENVLQQTIADFEGEALGTNQKQLEYTILKRNVETNQNLYDILLTKLKETNISSNVDISNIRVTEPAVVPNKPIKPKKMLNMVLAIILGSLTGIGLVFLKEYIDQTLRTEEDVQRYLGVPVLSVIPKAR
jgi:uncharacterized protein involved in exopolysaccharide biosynthesis